MSFPFQRRGRDERGYILLTLMLFVALLTIGLAVAVQNIESQIKRDREEELIHRGVQYSRAVRHYFKKFGRYPSRIEELENTNNMRFLRRRYKDPLTGKDFKLLHMTDVQMSFSGIPGGGLPPSALNGTAGGLNASASLSGAVVQDPTAAQNSQGADPSNPDQTNASVSAPDPNSSQPNGSSIPSNQPTSQTFGGGAIVGVASVSKDKTIREFNKKDHYNQWQFIYDPTTDRGGLLMTPNQPPLKGASGVAPGTGQNPSPVTGPQGPGNAPLIPNPQPPDQ